MDGLWTAEFGSSAGQFGGGVAVFREGKILGGDSTYYYTGEYKLSGNTFQATLRIFPFIQGAQSVFKTIGQDLTLELLGSRIDERQVIAQGSPREMPDLRIGMKLTKRA